MSKIITLYHGSVKKIEKPVYGFGKKHNDYGLGFYCTPNIELAKEWACQDNTDGYVCKYEINTEGLKILNLREYSLLHWITILSENRPVDSIQNSSGLSYLQENYHIDTSSYDIITGYRADDSYFAYARNFINNIISINVLKEAFKLGNLGIQVVMKSPKAFERLIYKESQKVFSNEYFAKFSERDTNARNKYKEICKNLNDHSPTLNTIIWMQESQSKDEIADKISDLLKQNSNDTKKPNVNHKPNDDWDMN